MATSMEDTPKPIIKLIMNSLFSVLLATNKLTSFVFSSLARSCSSAFFISFHFFMFSLCALQSFTPFKLMTLIILEQKITRLLSWQQLEIVGRKRTRRRKMSMNFLMRFCCFSLSVWINHQISPYSTMISMYERIEMRAPFEHIDFMVGGTGGGKKLECMNIWHYKFRIIQSIKCNTFGIDRLWLCGHLDVMCTVHIYVCVMYARSQR